MIDVKDPRKPALRSVTPTQLPATPLNDLVGVKGTNNGHIANCIQGCRYLWTTGTEEGIAVYDLANKSAPKFLGTFTMPVPKLRARQAHHRARLHPRRVRGQGRDRLDHR